MVRNGARGWSSESSFVEGLADAARVGVCGVSLDAAICGGSSDIGLLGRSLDGVEGVFTTTGVVVAVVGVVIDGSVKVDGVDAGSITGVVVGVYTVVVSGRHGFC